MKELIICSAVVFDGKVVKGHRHSDCIRTAHGMGIDTRHLSGAEGFITSQDRFVGREEAMEIHKASGAQPFRGKYHSDKELFSEDLY